MPVIGLLSAKKRGKVEHQMQMVEPRSLPRRGHNKVEKSAAQTEMKDRMMRPGEIGAWLVGTNLDSLGLIFKTIRDWLMAIMKVNEMLLLDK